MSTPSPPSSPPPDTPPPAEGGGRRWRGYSPQLLDRLVSAGRPWRVWWRSSAAAGCALRWLWVAACVVLYSLCAWGLASSADSVAEALSVDDTPAHAAKHTFGRSRGADPPGAVLFAGGGGDATPTSAAAFGHPALVLRPAFAPVYPVPAAMALGVVESSSGGGGGGAATVFVFAWAAAGVSAVSVDAWEGGRLVGSVELPVGAAAAAAATTTTARLALAVRCVDVESAACFVDVLPDGGGAGSSGGGRTYLVDVASVVGGGGNGSAVTATFVSNSTRHTAAAAAAEATGELTAAVPGGGRVEVRMKVGRRTELSLVDADGARSNAYGLAAHYKVWAAAADSGYLYALVRSAPPFVLRFALRGARRFVGVAAVARRDTPWYRFLRPSATSSEAAAEGTGVLLPASCDRNKLTPMVPLSSLYHSTAGGGLMPARGVFGLESAVAVDHAGILCIRVLQ